MEEFERVQNICYLNRGNRYSMLNNGKPLTIRSIT